DANGRTWPTRQGRRSTTFRRRKKQKGLESDNCYWIQNEHLVRGKFGDRDRYHSSLKRMKIYAALRVPEVWRFDGTDLLFHTLQSNGKYTVAAKSLAIPGITSADLLPFLAMLDQMDENAVIRQFRAWIRKRFNLGNP